MQLKKIFLIQENVYKMIWILIIWTLKIYFMCTWVFHEFDLNFLHAENSRSFFDFFDKLIKTVDKYLPLANYFHSFIGSRYKSKVRPFIVKYMSTKILFYFLLFHFFSFLFQPTRLHFIFFKNSCIREMKEGF